MSETERPWQAVNPDDMAKPVGYANAVVSYRGTRITLAGQIDMDADGNVAHPNDMLNQARGAFANVARVLAAAGGKPEHLVRMRIFVTDVAAYKALGREIGKAYREHFGTWFPAMSLFEIA
ncbi:MAG: RidA family protein, partial [Planctomycetota bacterium]|nr:RidA family protein [Planctomycetota bacterium]